ncbi:MAG: DUF4192 family protein [Actinomycetales bacterium]
MTSNHRSESSPARVTVRASQPRDLLASIPYLLGYHPRSSVVVVGVDGSRLGASARIDVQDVRHDPIQAGAQVGRLLRQARVRGVILVVYDDAEAGWLAGLVAGLERAGLSSLDGWQVTDRHYWPLGDPGAARPVQDLLSSSTSAELVAAGIAPAPERAEMLGCLEPYPAGLRSALRRAAARWNPLTDLDRMRAERLWAGVLADPAVPTPARSRSCAPPRPLSNPDLALLLAAVERLRGPFLAAVMSNRPPTEVLAAWRAGGADDELGVDGRQPPDPARTAAAVEVLTHLCRASCGPAAGTPLAMLALIHWWSGNGAMANLVVERAIAARPDDWLVQHVEATLLAGTAPRWVHGGTSAAAIQGSA